MRIALQNAHRCEQENGYGRINAYLARLVADCLDDESAEVQLFASPPYSFRCREAPGVIPGAASGVNRRSGRFYVGLTACDRDLSGYKNFDYVGLANAMDLLLVPSAWDRDMFRRGRITTPVEVVRLGHHHPEWFQPIERRENKRLFILDRGRDYSQAKTIAAHYFEVDYYRCSGFGKLSRDDLRARYREADVFLKWAEEGAWSYPAIEAMSAGCLLVTNCPYVYTSASNSLQFSSAADLQRVLSACCSKDYYEFKQQAQQDAAEWTEERSAAGIRAAIEQAFYRWSATPAPA